ncbi:hypothetical protein [Mucilaginibacter gilvus]|uniref:Uncharacterized protein n=1 Tax=Mucilaginibacter gilvus TaxID=2305909 RepID=A0A444MMP0_9SPHI|nr:hypothetical protein [Mucilaginibacter gilvus]RWY50940.1 hypothetical protein EPL05_12770 [Mucilaginibacter gilvus]
MRYNEWNTLSNEEKKSTHWKHHPRVRVATIFSILFAIVFAVALLRIFKNKRVHVNRKPNRLEAFTVAKTFIKNRLKQPAMASFPNNKFDALIDTAKNSYQISSYITAHDNTGHSLKTAWQINMAYTSGDWADTSSWRVANVIMNP